MEIKYELRIERYCGYSLQVFQTREEAATAFQKEYPDAYFIREGDSPVTKCFANREESFRPSGYIGSIMEIVSYAGGD